MVKNAFAILSMLTLTCGVAWGQVWGRCEPSIRPAEPARS